VFRELKEKPIGGGRFARAGGRRGDRSAKVVAHRHTFTLRNDITELQSLARVLEDLGRTIGLSLEHIHTLNLAMEEIITNIIRYGYEDDREHRIEVRIVVDDTRVNLEIEDDGKSFNPLEVPIPDVDRPIAERPIGGLGLFLVRNLMDELAYTRRGGKNILSMNKDFTHTS